MSVIDMKPIYIANYIGINQSNNKKDYTKPYMVYAQVGDPKSYLGYEDVGLLKDYDRVIYVPTGDKTQFINENILLWVGIQPNKECNNNDYVVSKIGDALNGYVPIYCKSLETNNVPLWYSNDNSTIYEIKCKYNKGTNVLISKLNDYIPIEKKTLVWFIKPNGIDSNKGKLRLVKKVQLNNSYKFTFEKVEK